MHMEFVDIGVICLQIIAYLLLLIGVYPFNNKAETGSFIKHGLLSIFSLGANLATVLLVMLPEFAQDTLNNSLAGMIQYPVMWAHGIIGLITISSALLIIGSWFREPLSELGCANRWKLMKPTFIVWGLAIASGVALIVFELI
jgi:hypothetical protein